MSSLKNNDDHEKLNSSMNIIEEEQNNTEPVPDCSPTVRKKSTSRERTSHSAKYTDDQSNKYEKRREHVQTHNNKTKHSSRSKVYVDKSNGHGNNDKVLENSNKKPNTERENYTSRKPTSHSRPFNRSNRHENSDYHFNHFHDYSRDQDKNPTAQNDCFLLTNDSTNSCEPENNFILCAPHWNDYTSREHRSRSERANKTDRREQFLSSFNQKYMGKRDRVKSTVPRNKDLADNHREPGPSTVGNRKEQCVHGEKITVERQATKNMSDAVEDAVAGLDSKDINDCGINLLCDSSMMSTDRSSRSRTLIDRRSPSSRRNHSSRRRRLSTSSDHHTYYSTSHFNEGPRSGLSSIDYYSLANYYYLLYSDRRSQEKRSSLDDLSAWAFPNLNTYRPLRRRSLSPYRHYRRDSHYSRDNRESRNRRYRSDSREGRNRRCLSDSREDRVRRYRSDSHEGRNRRYRSDSREGRNRRYRRESREGRVSRYRSDSRERRNRRYRSDSREGRNRRYRSDSREGRDCRYRSDSREGRDCRYRRESREGRVSRYRSDSREGRNRRYRSDSREGRNRRYRREIREGRVRRYRGDSREGRNRRYRCDSRECRDCCYRSDSREGRNRRYRRDSREGRDCRYRRNSREGRDCCYPSDSLEYSDLCFCIESSDSDDQCDICGNRFSSNDFMLVPFLPQYI